jgi:hypothetical protein
MCRELMLYLLGGAEFVEIAKTIFAAEIDGLEMNRAIRSGNYLAACENVHREVYGHSTWMKEI